MSDTEKKTESLVPLIHGEEFPWLRPVLLLLTLVAVFMTCWQPTWDPDTFMHLAMGREIWQTGHLVRTETLSFTASGKPWADFEWLFHALAYPIWHAGGFPLISLLTALTGALLAWVCYLAIRVSGGTTLAFALLFAVFMGPFQGRVRFRPDLASLILFAVLVLILVRQRSRGMPSLSTAFGMALLFLVWVQFHGGWAYGFGLLGVYAAGEMADAAFARRPLWPVVRAMTPLLAVPAVSLFINPSGWQVVRVPFDHLASMFIHQAQYVKIAEWQPTPFTAKTLPFWGGCLLLCFASAYFAGVRRGRWSEFLWVGSQTALAFLWVRYCSFAILSLAPVAAPYLDSLLKGKTIRAVCGVGVSILLVLRIGAAAAVLRMPDAMKTNYPVEEVGFLKQNEIGGNVFHPFVAGGYLDLEYAPLGRVFADGRYAPFRKDILDYFDSKDSLLDFRAFLARYPFQIAIYPYNPLRIPARDPNFPPRVVSGLIFPRSEWALVYFGPYGSVYLRRDPAYRAAIERFEYRYLTPEDNAYLIWAVREGRIPRDALLAEIERAERNPACPSDLLQLPQLKRTVVAQDEASIPIARSNR